MGSDEFGRAAARAAVARTLQAAGFASGSSSAVDALADVMLRYLRLLGGAANAHANHAGRASPNELDVVQFLEETGEAYQGFEGASSTRRGCLLSSGVVRDLVAFADAARDGPTSASQRLPRFPVQHAPPSPPSAASFAALGKGTGMGHVPAWLPAFPEPRTCAMAAEEEPGEKVGGRAVDEVEQVCRERNAGKSLLGLQRQLALAGGDGICKGDELNMAGIKSNPFLDSALCCGVKEVPVVAMPNLGKKRSVLESFAPAFTGSEVEGKDQGQGRGRKRMVPKERPPVYFKIGTDRRKSRVMAWNSRDFGGP
ncbi:transcription initiation factor TFIID subunit 8-like [Hordeum vulgare]|nr:transcription initiation factor TFIID subunit 8-like [Hordeum vulgare]